MRAEYDFDYSKAERGKYFKRLLKEGSNVVVLDRDVAKAFRDSAAVNKALRSVMKSRKPRRGFSSPSVNPAPTFKAIKIQVRPNAQAR